MALSQQWMGPALTFESRVTNRKKKGMDMVNTTAGMIRPIQSWTPHARYRSEATKAESEDWFDPERLRNDYVPTGFKGFEGKARTVKGHEFGLNLSAEEKKDLIAFLKTL